MPRSWLFLSEAFFKMLAEDANKLDGLDTCIVGITSDGYLIYDYIKLIDFHVEEHGMTEEESYEYVDYNILGLGGEGVNWVIMFPRYYGDIDELEECG